MNELIKKLRTESPYIIHDGLGHFRCGCSCSETHCYANQLCEESRHDVFVYSLYTQRTTVYSYNVTTEKIECYEI